MARSKRPSGVRVDCFLACDFAQVSGNKLNIIGGGWDRVMPPELPAEFDFYLALRATFSNNAITDTGDRVSLRLEMTDPDKQPIGAMPLTAEIELVRGNWNKVALNERGLAIPMRLTVVFMKPGIHAIELFLNEQPSARLQLDVQPTLPELTRSPE